MALLLCAEENVGVMGGRSNAEDCDSWGRNWGAWNCAELTNDPGWQEKYEITIYQMGWRLGGKGASGRNREISDRIQEHGIHLWMGFYENAFQMIRQVYDEARDENSHAYVAFYGRAEGLLADELYADDGAGGRGVEAVAI